MQMKKKGSGDAPPKQKERHIVTWSQQVDSLSSTSVLNLLEKFSMFFRRSLCFYGHRLVGLQEDDILREQISLHGTEK